MDDILSDFRWYRLRLELVSLHAAKERISPLVVMEVVGKALAEQLGWRKPGGDFLPAKPLLFFHPAPGKAPNRATFEFFLCRADDREAARFAEALQAYFSAPAHQVSWVPTALGSPEERSIARIYEELGEIPGEGELCLDFLSALPFGRDANKSRTYISKSAFLEAFLRRFSRLFGCELRYESSRDDFRLLPYYWHFCEHQRNSVSQPGTKQFVVGCAGPLYLKGRYADFLPFLVLGHELHAGSKLSNAQGHYRLHPDSLPYFSRHFGQAREIKEAFEEVLRRRDSALLDHSLDKGAPQTPELFADRLAAALACGEWRPTPNNGFAVAKKNGGERVVESLALEDLVVHQLLRERLSPVVEHLAEESAWGYRKNRSREQLAEHIRQTIREGYRFVVESDIDTFFPSVQLARLFTLLEALIPKQDGEILDLLKACLRNGYTLKGRLREREAGLAQGSPLSPLLANLYLDAFDEDLEAQDARMFRYADDFVILTRTEEQAGKALAWAGESLATLGLALKEEKTSLHAVENGFSFLGIEFASGEKPPSFAGERKRLKKPLFITEPYLFLGRDGDCVTVSKEGTLIESLPLRRLSEVLVLAQASVSTGFLETCAKAHVPVSLALGKGYDVTTIRPDSKEYYLTAARHVTRFEGMTDTERLAIAQELVRTKILNYLPLFKQRYAPGTNLLLHDLRKRAQQALTAATSEELLGVEGSAARAVWEALGGELTAEGFPFTGRRRRPPDRLNSLLNFGYYLLFTRLNALLRAAGLNPYLGFLHSPQDDYESLVCDLQEVFRSRVDRLILRLVNLKAITPSHFTESERGFFLTSEGSKLFIQHYEAELIKKGGPEELSWLDLLQVQVVVVKRWALEEGSLTFFLWE